MITTSIENNTILATEDNTLVGKMEFEQSERELIIMHTYAYVSGKGIGSILMEKAIQYAQEQELIIRPVCSFAVKYLQKTH